MKKLLLIAFLTVAMVFTLVACTEEKPPEETTGETTGVTSGESADETTAETPADTDPVDETDPPVEDTDPPVEDTDPPVEDTKAPETDPPVEDTKAPETDPPVVDEGAKPWDELKDVVTHLSFDELRKNDTTDGIFAPGQAAGWDLKATVEEDITSLKFWGWIGIADAEVGLFGYQIDDNDPIYDAAWTHATGDDVIAAAAGTGAQTASRMLININLSKIAGEHTVKTLYKNAAGDKEVILAEFTITRNAPAIVDEATAGLVAKNVDAENADNFSAGLAGWIGFGQSITELGFSIDDGDIVWLGADGINPTPEDAVFGIAGENAIRYNIQADLTTVPYGAHTVTFYVRLEDRNMVPFYAKDVVTNDPTAVGDSSFDFDSAETPDLSTLFTFKVGLNPELCNYTAAPYKMEGINQLTLTADGTYKMTIKNLNATNGSSVVFFRGNPNPAFGDANYYGHDGGAGQVNGDTSVGCSGIYVGIITENEAPVLRINVKGVGENGAALPQIFTVPMTGRDLTVVDDNDTVKFYEGETLLATVDVNGFNKGYATEVIVTIGETSTTLDNVSVAASAASDIGFVARSTGLYWDAVTLEKLGTGSNEPDPADDDTHNFVSDVANQGADFVSSDVVVNLFPAGAPGSGTMSWYDVTGQNGNKVVPGESYQLNNYNEMFTQANGHYAYSATIVDNADPNRNFMFVRGVRNFDFGDEGYFGHDGNNSYAGCGGIYTMVKDGVLLITIRSYTNGALVRNTYTVYVDSNKITLADDGNTVYIIVGDKLVATVEISGTRDFGYTGKAGAVATDACADKVILTLAGQEPVEVVDAIVAATCNSDLGMAIREHGNYIKFSALSLVGFSTVEIPEMVAPETPEDIPVVEGEPENPVKVIGAMDLATAAGLNNVVITPGDGYTTFTFDGTVGTPGNDPYCSLVAGYNGARYIAVKYRAPELSAGMNMQIYVGSGNLANDDQSLQQVITADGEWHILIFDLDELVTKMDENYKVSFLRLDALQAGIKYNEDGTPVVPDPERPTTYEKLPIPEGASVDVAYIAFFNAEVEEPTILSPEEAGMLHLAKDAVTADNYSTSLVGWMGFGDVEMVKFGYSIDDGDIIWEGGKFNNFNTPEEGEIIKNSAGSAARRFAIVTSLAGIPYGEHIVYYYVELANGTICNVLAQDVTTSDPSAIGSSTVNFDSAVNADLSSVMNFGAGLSPENCVYKTASYKMTGINQIIMTMDGTYEMTVGNLKGQSVAATMVFRGNPNPNFGDANYYGHDGNVLGVGCAGIYVTILDEGGVPTLNINVRGVNADGGAVSHPYKVAMNSYNLRIVDDNKSVKFYEGDTLLATVAISGEKAGYATEAVVTLANGATETLTDVCVASTVASDIGFIARGAELTFDAVTIKGI